MNKKQTIQMRKKVFKALIAMLSVALLLPWGMIKAVASTETEHQTVRIGYYEFAGFQELDAEGNRTGYGYDFFQEIARYTGWKYDYVGYDLGWSKLQQMLDDGEIDMLPSARKTPEREQKYFFSDPMGTSSGILTVKSGDTKVTIGDYDTYNGLHVGMIKDSSINKGFEKFAEEKGFSYTPVYYLNAEDMNADLQNETNIDAVCTTDLRKVQNEWILDKFDTASFYVMMRKEDTTLQQELNEAIAQMNLYSPGWQTLFHEKYYTPDTGEGITFTTEEKAYIQEMQANGQYVTVAVNPDAYPYSYFENGQAEGIIPSIVREISERTGIPLEMPEMKSRENYFSAIEEHQTDVIADSVFDYNTAEKNNYRMTISYLTTPVTQLERRNFTGTADTIAVLEEETEKVPDLVKNDTTIHLVNYASIEDCVNAVIDGNADTTYLYPYTAQKYLNTGKGSTLSATLLPDSSISLALSVSNHADLLLLQILNKGVASVKSDYVNAAILQQVATQHTDMTLMEYLLLHPFLAAIAILTIAMLLSSISILVIRGRSVKIIKRQNQQLLDLNQQLEKAAEAKSNFLSNISHDLRTPLNGILSYTNFAIMENDPEKKAEYLQKASRSGIIMRDLINDTLDISKIESGKFVLNQTWISGKELIDSVITVIQAAADSKHIQLLLDLDCPKHEEIYADSVKIKEIYLNLLNNAIKYTPEGGHCKLSIKRQNETPDHIELVSIVEDNGVGISKDFLPKIFEPFTQESAAQANNMQGTGLGLSIVKRIVDMMNGTITAESEKGKGTIFTVMIPLSVREEVLKQEAIKQDVKLDGMKLLLCEDNLMNAEIAANILQQRGAETVCAENGYLGLEQFRNSAVGEYSAILMDVHMPVLNGYEATAAIRQLGRPDAAAIPIIAMTADAYDSDIRKCLDSGMNAHVSKPIDPDKLCSIIAEAVGQ